MHVPVHRIDPGAFSVNDDERHQRGSSHDDGADLRHVPSSLHQFAAEDRLRNRYRHPPDFTDSRTERP